jgi:hypothetical protein
MQQEKVKYLVEWGKRIKEAVDRPKGEYEGLSKAQINFLLAMTKSGQKNPWFTNTMVQKAISGVLQLLDESSLLDWANKYEFKSEVKTIGIVMAGNIPLVGFHDLLCVLMSPHNGIIKCSSEDSFMIPALLNLLDEIQPIFTDRVKVEEKLEGMDAVIATGSNNTARYFEYYFGKYPNIIRKSRTSMAVLDGTESEEALQLLSKDIFDYYGLGCRNVNYLWLPKSKKIQDIIELIMPSADWVQNSRYMNNLDYNKSVYLINRTPFLDGGRYLLLESESLFSPISVVHFNYYENLEDVQNFIKKQGDQLQCIVDKKATWGISFGETQKPGLLDYPDDVDVMEFLAKV